MRKLLIRNLGVAALLSCVFSLLISPTSLANVSDVENVVNSYLNSLASGDVAAIEGLIDGPLAQHAARSFRNPERYSAFLREQYDQVSMTVLSVDPVAEVYHAAVQFIYPSGNTISYILVVSKVDNAWKLIDEIKEGSH
jgi:hypothetical protein